MKPLKLLHSANGDKPAKAMCTCGHIGACPKSDHQDSKLELGHGRCKVEGCKCQRFTWKGFVP